MASGRLVGAARLPVLADASDVAVLERRSHHLFQPLLHHVATAILSEGQIACCLRDTLQRYKNIRVEHRSVTGFDDRPVVSATCALHASVEVPYESLIVATGEVSRNAGTLSSGCTPGNEATDDAVRDPRRTLGALEMPEATPDPVDKQMWSTIVVVGA